MFSPFERPLEALVASDLERLRDVAEGWYVEYKRQVSRAADIAKSISALANTHGGWVFYGVQELSKDDSVAGSFPGVPRKELDAALQIIRQGVAQHMNPAAFFDVRAIEGDGNSLAVDRFVICVRVPSSLAAPHVHASGRIYRRVADGSEPRPENDRFVLDQLFRRSDDLRSDFERWLERDPELSEGEGKIPYLRLMMIADPWRVEEPWLQIELADLKALFNEPGQVSSLPFDTLYTSAQGYVARQTSENDPHHLGLTWRFREHLVSDVFVPLDLHVNKSHVRLSDHLQGYETATRFTELLASRNYASPRVVDLNMLFNLLVGVVEIQRRLLTKAGWTQSYFIKARLLNVWRTIPFVDVGAIVDSFETDGLPVCLDAVSTTPPGADPDSFVEVPPMIEIENEQARIVLQALMIFAPIARAWGLPANLTQDGQPMYFSQLQEAGQRAMNVQKRRARLRAAISQS